MSQKREVEADIICYALRARDQLLCQNPQNSTLTALKPIFRLEKNHEAWELAPHYHKKNGNISFTEFNDISFIMCTSG